MQWPWQRRARKMNRRAGSPVSEHRALDERCGLRTAKPCGSGTRCWCQVGGGVSALPGPRNLQSADDGDKMNSSPGRARNKPLKPLRRECRCDAGEPVVTTVCLLPLHTGCGCIGHPAFPAPSVFWRDTARHSPGRFAPRDRKIVSAIERRPREAPHPALACPSCGTSYGLFFGGLIFYGAASSPTVKSIILINQRLGRRLGLWRAV